MTKIPRVWATSSDVAEHFRISTRHLRHLRTEWEKAGILVEGKHYFWFGPRTLRFDMALMCKAAHVCGRVLPPYEPCLKGLIRS